MRDDLREKKAKALRMLTTFSVAIASRMVYDDPMKIVTGFFVIIVIMAITSQPGSPMIGMNPVTMALSFLSPCAAICAHVASIFMPKGTTTRIRSKEGEEIVRYKQHSLTSTLIDVSVNWIGNEMYVEYIGKPDFNNGIIDQYDAIDSKRRLRDIVTKVTQTRWIVIGVLIVGAIATASNNSNWAVLMTLIMAMVFVENNKRDTSLKPDLNEARNPIGMAEGLYQVKCLFMGFQVHRGIAYVEKGTLYTKEHVTAGNNILDLYGVAHRPCYVNKKTDHVCYGSQPSFARLSDGEEIVVCLAGHRSANIVMYSTSVTITDRNTVMFRGSKSTPGSSGSPYFRIKYTKDGEGNDITTYEFAGCIGWFIGEDPNEDHDPRVGVELGKSEPIATKHDLAPLDFGELRQIFMHPGAGKTRTCMPTFLKEGIRMYGKVFVTGNSLTVCRELKQSLESIIEREGLKDIKVSLATSDATPIERGSPNIRNVVIAAHDTMLSMIIKGIPMVQGKGLWIMDEAHVLSSMCLKDHLRSICQGIKSRTLVEMTATGFKLPTATSKGYLVNMTGSNYHIEDVVANDQDIIKMITEERGKALVFATSVKGHERTSIQSLNKIRKGLALHRATFAKNYAAAKEMKTGIIYTTDISECGANYGTVDTVYDFQRGPKPIQVTSKRVNIGSTFIDQCQRTQRRGRTGRLAEGKYVSPGYNLPEADWHRAEYFDRITYAKNTGIRILDEVPVELAPVTLTPNQVAYWKGAGEKGIEGPGTVELFVGPDGTLLRDQELANNIRQWRRGDEYTHVVGDEIYNVASWDDRDRDLLVQCLGAYNIKEPNMFKEILSRLTRSVPVYKTITVDPEPDEEERGEIIPVKGEEILDF